MDENNDKKNAEDDKKNAEDDKNTDKDEQDEMLMDLQTAIGELTPYSRGLRDETNAESERILRRQTTPRTIPRTINRQEHVRREETIDLRDDRQEETMNLRNDRQEHVRREGTMNLRNDRQEHV